MGVRRIQTLHPAKTFSPLLNVVVQFGSGDREVKEDTNHVTSINVFFSFQVAMGGYPTLQSQGSSGFRAINGSGLNFPLVDLWLIAQFEMASIAGQVLT